MVKIGLIGAGYMGGMHSACYEELKASGACVTAVADLREEKRKAAADRFGAVCYETGMELIEQADVDVIDICLPTYLHTEHALAAMKKRRAVFIEKPVCLTPEEGKRLLEAQKEYGAIVMVGQCIRFWDEYVWLREAIEQHRYGRIKSAVFQRVSPYPDWAWEEWLHRSECSGTVALDMHVHDIDFIRYLMGDPDRVSAAAVRNDGAIYQIFSTLEYPEAVVHAEACWDYPKDFPFSMSFRVKCEKATIVYDSSRPEGLMVYPIAGGAENPELTRQFQGQSGAGGNISSLGGYYNELKYFVECLNTGTEPVIAPLCEAVKSMELCRREIDLAGGTDL
jgi:predicted dehydrogenase